MNNRNLFYLISTVFSAVVMISVTIYGFIVLGKQNLQEVISYPVSMLLILFGIYMIVKHPNWSNSYKPSIRNKKVKMVKRNMSPDPFLFRPIGYGVAQILLAITFVLAFFLTTLNNTKSMIDLIVAIPAILAPVVVVITEYKIAKHNQNM